MGRIRNKYALSSGRPFNVTVSFMISIPVKKGRSFSLGIFGGIAQYWAEITDMEIENGVEGRPKRWILKVRVNWDGICQSDDLAKVMEHVRQRLRSM